MIDEAEVATDVVEVATDEAAAVIGEVAIIEVVSDVLVEVAAVNDATGRKRHRLMSKSKYLQI